MLNAIFNRRSIRKYKDTPVPRELIDQLLKCAMYAPTGKDTQLWHFMVIDDKALMAEFQKFMPYSAMLDTAPCLIIVCADMNKNSVPYYYMGDCGAATQNILLGAYELGLGSCWLGIAPNEERIGQARDLFKMPDNIVPFCGIALGYADQVRDMPQRFDNEKTHFNKW